MQHWPAYLKHVTSNNMERIHCSSCEYSTTKKSNFRDHLKSKTHVVKCKNCKTCPNCLRTFSKQGPCNQHIAACKVELLPRSFERAKKKFNNSTKTITFQELIRDEFTSSLHRICLLQMQKEESDINDYLEEVDNIIEAAKRDYDIEQQEDFNNGESSKIKEYKLPILKFYRILVDVLCNSITNLVITHMDISIDGQNRRLLFKHKGMLYGDSIIREISKKSKFSYLIVDNESELPVPRDTYKKLLDRLYSAVVSRRGEHNFAVKRAKARQFSMHF